MLHVVEFEPNQKIPERMVAKHGGYIRGTLAIFPTLDQHSAFLETLQARVNELMAKKGLASFDIRKG